MVIENFGMFFFLSCCEKKQIGNRWKILFFGKRGGKSGLILTRPLIIYRDRTNKEYSDDMNYIMNEGSFPSAFIR